MPSSSKKSADGLAIFAGGEFDDWFATVFVPFCKRKRLCKCLDRANDPRGVYELPDLHHQIRGGVWES